MGHYLHGEQRDQSWLLPPSIEDYVSADNPVRVMEAFVDGLDLRALGIDSTPAHTGRPAYAPAALLKLYIYGYLNRVRSSRELERLTHRNLEVIWLLRGLRPDHKTISEFRRQHKGAFRQVLRQFNLLCRELKLFGAELVALDGSVFKAVNSREHNFTLEKLGNLIRLVDTGIERYLKELDLADSQSAAASLGGGSSSSSSNGKADDLRQKLEQLRATRQRHEAMLQQLQDQEQTQVSLVDADARLMKKSTSHDSTVGYNVQSVVDAAHHLIVEVEATTQGNDFGQLNAMAQQAKEQLGVEELTVVADAGYHAIADLREAEQQGIRAHVPEQRKASPQAGLLGKEAFRYDAAEDEYECPGGQRLTRHSDSEQRGQKQHVYYNTQACAACPLRQRCTTGRYRKIKHLEGQPWVQERIRERMRQQPEVYAQRKSLVEHPFGTIKFWWGQGAFLTRGLASVQAEVSLSALAYNLRRALNILGVEALRRHLSHRTQRA